MPVDPSAQIHPSAIISSEANLGRNVQVGPFTVIEGPVDIGNDCVLNPHVHLIGPLLMGRGNGLAPARLSAAIRSISAIAASLRERKSATSIFSERT